jgi:hypothetical protein
MWALAPSVRHAEDILPPLGPIPQNATGPPTAPTEITKSNPSNHDVHLQTNVLSPPQSHQPISPSHFPNDHHDTTHRDIKYLEQLLESSLATVAAIPFSGNTLADILTPRAYDTYKALHALAALDMPTSSTTTRGSNFRRSTFSDIGNDCPHSSNRSPPLPNSSLAIPRTGRIHLQLSMSAEYVIHFSWAGLAAVCCLFLFLFNLPRLWERIFM